MSIKKYLISKINSLNVDQSKLFKELQSHNKLQLCIPTGGGKNYIMMIDILNQLVSTDKKIFTISSHRLMLNNQHMNDMFNMFSLMIGKIGFVFVGSSKYDVSKFLDNITFNKALLKKKLGYHEIISSTTNTKEVDSLIKGHLEAGRKVIIMTTYHSLHTLKNQVIDTLYCDEAHTLASDEDGARFKENFNMISAERKFFLTATPKDCVEKVFSGRVKSISNKEISQLIDNNTVFWKNLNDLIEETIKVKYKS